MDKAWLSGQLVVRPPGSQLISSELTAECKCKELTDSLGACLGGEAFHAGGETLYEEQTSVSKGGWQQHPPSSFRRLSSHPEVETASSLESRDLHLPTESRSEALSSRPGPEKPHRFCFCSLGSQRHRCTGSFTVCTSLDLIPPPSLLLGR